MQYVYMCMFVCVYWSLHIARQVGPAELPNLRLKVRPFYAVSVYVCNDPFTLTQQVGPAEPQPALESVPLLRQDARQGYK
jgi:hypothetical protein